MRSVILTIVFSITAIFCYAQDRQKVTIPYNGGTLTYEYYEKDGVKIPDGFMEYTKGNYTEKGQNKDGYKEGEWIQTLKVISGSGYIIDVKYNFEKGLLEGKTIYKAMVLNINNIYKSNLNKDNVNGLINVVNEYNFHKGHLFGENVVSSSNDTVYCNFNEAGERIGEWKFRHRGRTIVIDYTKPNPDKSVAKKIDEWGFIDDMDINDVELKLVKLFSYWSHRFTQEPLSISRDKRVELPTLSNNKYGICDQLKPIDVGD